MNLFDLSKIQPERHSRIREHLLWEVNEDNFDYQKGRSIIVERVVQRGNMDDWLTLLLHKETISRPTLELLKRRQLI